MEEPSSALSLLNLTALENMRSKFSPQFRPWGETGSLIARISQLVTPKTDHNHKLLFRVSFS